MREAAGEDQIPVQPGALDCADGAAGSLLAVFIVRLPRLVIRSLTYVGELPLGTPVRQMPLKSASEPG